MHGARIRRHLWTGLGVLVTLAALAGAGSAAAATGSAAAATGQSLVVPSGNGHSSAAPEASGSTSGISASVQGPEPAPALVSQSVSVVNGGTFSVSFGIPVGISTADGSVGVTVYDKLPSRSDFVQSLQGHLGPELKSFGTVPLSSLSSSSIGGYATTQNNVFSFSFQVSSGESTATSGTAPTSSSGLAVHLDNCPQSGCSGVYPIEIRLTGAGVTVPVQPLVTHMVYVESTQSLVKLGFSWTVPISSLDSPDQLGRVVSAIGRNPQVPIDVIAVPQTITRLSEAAKPADLQTLSQLSSLVAPSQAPSGSGSGTPGSGVSPGSGSPPGVSSPGSPVHELLPATFSPVNISALAQYGLDGEIAIQFQRGASVLESSLHAQPSSAIWATDTTMDRQGIAVLQSQGVNALVLPDTDLAPISSSLTVTQPWVLQGPDRYNPLVAISDPGLESDVSSTDDPVLAAHRVLADLAQVWSDAPNQTSPPRALVFLSSPEMQVDPVFEATLLQGLSSDPIVQPLTLSQYFAQIPPVGGSSHPDIRSIATNTRVPPLPSTSIRAARSQVDSFASVVRPGQSHVSPISDLVLDAETDGLTYAQRQHYLTEARTEIRSIVSGVILAGTRTVTLTSRTASIPINITSAVPFPLHAEVVVSSDKLDFPHGDVQPVSLTNTTNTVSFRVTARTSGAFLLRVSVIAPTGTLVLASASITVRSTAYSGMAFAITALAVLFLIIWWGRTIFRSRRAERCQSE